MDSAGTARLDPGHPRTSLLSLLNCPYCGGAVQEECPATPSQDPDYGVLRCGCSRYPVVAGIPVFRRGVIGTGGRLVTDVLALIESGRHSDALLCMISPPPPASPALAPALLKALPATRATRWLEAQCHALQLPSWRRSVSTFLAQRDSLTARDILDFCLQRSQRKQSIGYEYLAYRFGQPRHLVALSLTSLIRRPLRPVLELACGWGHITRSLLNRAAGQPVVGVDRSFLGLYVAKNWIAPGARYICYDADGTLPFPDASFSTAVCVDGIQYFDHKVGTIGELKRVAQDNILLLGSRNARVHPHGPTTVALHGHPLSPEDYRRLVADTPHRLIAETETLGRYVNKLGPCLAESSSPERLAKAPLLSIVVSRRGEIFREHGAFEDWPHADGRLMVNPLYRELTPGSDGRIELALTFPSRFYEEENSECRQYLPDSVRVEPRVLADVKAGRRTPDVERLLEKCVVLGVPDRYW